jgi:hypothetical protein
MIFPPPERAAFARREADYEVEWFQGLKRTERTVQEAPAGTTRNMYVRDAGADDRPNVTRIRERSNRGGAWRKTG